MFAECHADGAFAVEQDLFRQRAGDDAQIVALTDRVQVAYSGGAALAVARGGLVIADAVLASTVEVVVARIAKLHCAFDECLADRMVLGRVGHAERAAGAVELVRSARLMFGALEVGQHIGRRPSGIAELPPQIEILVLAADIDHAVDAGRTTEHLAARPEDATAVGTGIGLGLIAPVHRGIGKGLAVA